MPRYRWVILAVGVLAQASFAAVVQGLPAIAPALRRAYGMDLNELGLVLGCTLAGLVLSILAWGTLADRVGERLVMTVGLTLAAAALVAASLSTTVGSLASMLVLSGIGGGSVNAASGKAVAGWFGDHQRGFAMGVRQTALPLGGAIGAAVLPPIAGFNVRAALVTLAGMCLLSAIVVAIWMREPPPPAGVHPHSPRPLRNAGVWAFAAATGLLVVPQFSFVAFVVLYLHDERGIPAQAAAAVLAGVQLVGAAARITLGRRSDRTGRRVRPVRTIAAVMVILFLTTALFLPARNVVVLPLLVLAGVFAISWNGLAFAATVELVRPEHRGRALGMINTAGAAAVKASSWRTAYALLAAFPAVTLAVLGPLAGADHGPRLSRPE